MDFDESRHAWRENKRFSKNAYVTYRKSSICDRTAAPVAKQPALVFTAEKKKTHVEKTTKKKPKPAAKPAFKEAVAVGKKNTTVAPVKVPQSSSQKVILGRSVQHSNTMKLKKEHAFPPNKKFRGLETTPKAEPPVATNPQTLSKGGVYDFESQDSDHGAFVPMKPAANNGKRNSFADLVRAAK